MKILVTGGAGFIGSHLVERLLNEENEVTVLDNFNTGKRENLKPHSNLEVITGTITDTNMLLYKNVDVVFHLAALTRPQWSIEHPLEANFTNVQGTLNVFKQAKDAKVKRVVFTSSSSCYGEQTKFPIPETAPIKAMSPYGLQKWMGEEYAKLFERMYGLEVNCIRPANVYGSRQNPSGGYAAAVPAFITMLMKDEQPFITGSGDQSRDFTYVDDVVDMLIKAANSSVYGETFNTGGGRNVSINEIYSIISKTMNKENIKPNHIDAVYEPFKTLFDTTKAKKILKWKPTVSIEEGLKKTVEGYLNA